VRGGSAPWCPTGTGCDYYTEYLDPIVNDARAGEWAKAQTQAAQVAEGQSIGGQLAAVGADLVGGATSIVNSGFGPMVLGAFALLFLFQGFGTTKGNA